VKNRNITIGDSGEIRQMSMRRFDRTGDRQADEGAKRLGQQP
jgi:hypothetical protein